MLGYEVFSDTKASRRAVLGEWVTAWLRANPSAEVLDRWVRQSSDREFHCVSITLQYEDHGVAIKDVPRPEPAVYPQRRRTYVHGAPGCTCGGGYTCSLCAGLVRRNRGVRDA